MQNENYFQIASFEKTNWWYRSRRDLLDKMLGSLKTRFSVALDAGCGVGSNAGVLLKHCDEVYGLDMSKIACEFCADKGYKKIIVSSLPDFTSDEKFDLIVCMDVLEHLDDSAAIVSLRSHLNDNGILVVSVPAHRYLWNMNDDFSHHLRRYELKDLKGLMREHGLEVIKLSYWNQLMFVPTLVYSAIARGVSRYVTRRPQNNLNLIPEFLNGILYNLLKIENSIFLRHDLIEGVSIICLCKNTPHS